VLARIRAPRTRAAAAIAVPARPPSTMSGRPRRTRPTASAEPVAPVEIFHAGRQGVKVRAVQALVLLVVTPVALWGAADLIVDPAVSRASAAEYVAWPVRYGTAAFLLVIGVGGALGMLVYGRCYVMRAVWDPAALRCRLTLAGIGASARVTIPAAAGVHAVAHEGRFRTPKVTVHAPWFGIRVPGRRFPLVLDAQGEFLHPELVRRVLLGGEAGSVTGSRPPRRKAARRRSSR
jgi:hypothetical protein